MTSRDNGVNVLFDWMGDAYPAVDRCWAHSSGRFGVLTLSAAGSLPGNINRLILYALDLGTVALSSLHVCSKLIASIVPVLSNSEYTPRCCSVQFSPHTRVG